MIKSTTGKFAVEIAKGKPPKKFPPDLIRRAQLKLAAIHAATHLKDLKSPPGNRLEALSGNRKGQHSIRINNQWRICFRWLDGNAEEVEIVDYH